MPRSARANNGSPYKSHPLYKLRVAIIITAVLGILLSILSILIAISEDPYIIPLFTTTIFFLLVSIFIVTYDFVSYTTTQLITPPSCSQGVRQPLLGRTHGGERVQEWPTKRLVTLDFIMAGLFQWLFRTAFFALLYGSHSPYYTYHIEAFDAYANLANLANLAASIEHAIAFWEGLVARKRLSWRRDLEQRPCSNCGHILRVSGEMPTSAQANSSAGNDAVPPDTLAVARAGTGEGEAPKCITRPDLDDDDGPEDSGDGAAGDVMQGRHLLETPDGSCTGVAAMDRSVESLITVPAVLVKDDKGKKKLVGAD